MASIDIIETASDGYRLVWRERHYLLRLAALPFIIKLGCYFAMLALGWEHNFLRQALIMIPSFFADGWMLSHMTRLIFFDQRWPFRPTGDTDRDMQILQDRALGIMRGTLTFAVIKYLMSGVTALMYIGTQNGASMHDTAMSPLLFAGALAFLLVFLWAFRLAWLFIPAALNFPLSRFLRMLGGFSASWFMIGIWLMCFLPWYFVFGFVLSLFGEGAGGAAVVAADFLRVLLDMIVNILATAGIALAIRRYMSARSSSAP